MNNNNRRRRLRYIPMVPDAAHQIRLTFDSHTSNVCVFCTCRRGRRIAMLETGEDPWPHYNNPSAHDERWVKFHGSSTETFEEATGSDYSAQVLDQLVGPNPPEDGQR